MEGLTISSNTLAIITGLVSIGTPMAMLAYNAGKMRQQMVGMKEDILELRDLIIDHIKDTAR